jgi:hypothetical protein
VLQYHFNWKTISVAAGMTVWNFYFQIFEKAVGKEETFSSSRTCSGTSRHRYWWSGTGCQRTAAGWWVSSWIAWTAGSPSNTLPPYAPELNPVEYLWGHWKQHTLPNVCPFGNDIRNRKTCRRQCVAHSSYRLRKRTHDLLKDRCLLRILSP